MWRGVEFWRQTQPDRVRDAAIRRPTLLEAIRPPLRLPSMLPPAIMAAIRRRANTTQPGRTSGKEIVVHLQAKLTCYGPTGESIPYFSQLDSARTASVGYSTSEP